MSPLTFALKLIEQLRLVRGMLISRRRPSTALLYGKEKKRGGDGGVYIELGAAPCVARSTLHGPRAACVGSDDVPRDEGKAIGVIW